MLDYKPATTKQNLLCSPSNSNMASLQLISLHAYNCCRKVHAKIYHWQNSEIMYPREREGAPFLPDLSVQESRSNCILFASSVKLLVERTAPALDPPPPPSPPRHSQNRQRGTQQAITATATAVRSAAATTPQLHTPPPPGATAAPPRHCNSCSDLIARCGGGGLQLKCQAQNWPTEEPD